MPVRAVIVDDEPLARQKLRELLENIADLVCVAEAVDCPSAVKTINELRPDLVFLDIQMPGGSGLDVLERIDHDPDVIFTTAYDQYAVAAFELQAVDYLLKPFGRERLEKAVGRAMQRHESTESSVDRAREAFRRGPTARILVRDRGKIIPIMTRDIARLEADDDYTQVVAHGKTYLVYLRLHDFLQVLDAERFVQIHRSHIVNLDQVRSIGPADGGRLTVEMLDGAKVPVSRARAKELRDRAL